jgi:hypothetical protein
VINKAKEEEKKGGFSKSLSWLAEKMCGKSQPAVKEEKQGSQTVKAPQARPTISDEEKKINQMKADREKELQQHE